MTEKKVVEQPEGEFSDIWFHLDYLYEEEEEKKSELPYTIALIDESLGLDRWTFLLEKAKKGRGHWGHRGRKGKRGGSLPSKGKVSTLKATNFFDRKDRITRPSLTATEVNATLSKLPEQATELLADVDIKVYSDQFLPEEAKGAGAFYHHGMAGVSSSFSPELGVDRLLHELGHAAVDKLGPKFAEYVHAKTGKFLRGDVEEDVTDWFADYAVGRKEPIWAEWFEE